MKKIIITIIIILCTAFIIMGYFKLTQNNIPYTEEKNIFDHPMEKFKTTEWALISGDANKSCSNPTWRGNTEIKGWYVLSDAYYNDKKEWRLRIEDESKLPITLNAKNIEYKLEGASPEQEKNLKQATELQSVTLNIKEFSLYCEGAPVIRINE